jgi:hypothetical protein
MLYEGRFISPAGFGRIELSAEIRYREGPKLMVLGHHGSCTKAITPLGMMRKKAIAYGGGMVWIDLTWTAAQIILQINYSHIFEAHLPMSSAAIHSSPAPIRGTQPASTQQEFQLPVSPTKKQLGTRARTLRHSSLISH